MHITFVGGGNMAGAIIHGLTQQGGHVIRVVDIHQDRLNELTRQFAIQGSLMLPNTFNPNEIVVLAIKPQQLLKVCTELAGRLNHALVVSLVAGVRVEALIRWLCTARVVRVMPNIPAKVGYGLSGLFVPAGVSEQDRQQVDSLMKAVGQTSWFNVEAGLDDITAIAGSGPAYVFYFVESMIEAACQLGYAPDMARQWVLATFAGAVELIRHSTLPVEMLRANVTSTGGTTERAIARFEAEHVKAAIIAGVMDCRARSIEMGQLLNQE